MAIHTAGMGILRGNTMNPGVFGTKRGVNPKPKGNKKKVNLRYSRSPISVAAQPNRRKNRVS